jgi:hypothetical protein
MIRWYHYFWITFFASIRAQYVSQSLVLLSSQGRQFLPVKASAQLISSSIVNSVRECFDACHANILCRIFDYDAIVSQQCCLFEGDLDTLGSIVPPLMSDSTAGTIDRHVSSTIAGTWYTLSTEYEYVSRTEVQNLPVCATGRSGKFLKTY